MLLKQHCACAEESRRGENAVRVLTDIVQEGKTIFILAFRGMA